MRRAGISPPFYVSIVCTVGRVNPALRIWAPAETPRAIACNRGTGSMLRSNVREGKTAPMGGCVFDTPEAIAFFGLFQRIEDALTG